jgi:hypothetical protein
MTHFVDGVVDIERDRLRRLREARAELVDERKAHARDSLQGWRVLEPADGRLRGERDAAVGRTADRDLHQGIVPQSAQIVAVLIAAGDGERPHAHEIDVGMDDPRRIAPVAHRFRDSLRHPEPPVGLAQEQEPAVRREPAAAKIDCELPAGNGWQIEGKEAIVRHGGCGFRRRGSQIASTTNCYASSMPYAMPAMPQSRPW